MADDGDGLALAPLSDDVCGVQFHADGFVHFQQSIDCCHADAGFQQAVGVYQAGQFHGAAVRQPPCVPHGVMAVLVMILPAQRRS